MFRQSRKQRTKSNDKEWKSFQLFHSSNACSFFIPNTNRQRSTKSHRPLICSIHLNLFSESSRRDAETARMNEKNARATWKSKIKMHFGRITFTSRFVHKRARENHPRPKWSTPGRFSLGNNLLFQLCSCILRHRQARALHWLLTA